MLLEVDVTKDFPGFQCRISFTLRDKKCGVFGPSGSGKSTLMHMLAGLLEPDNGFIRLNDTTLFDSEQKINLPPEARRIGVVFQHARLFPHMSVKKNLFYGMQRIPRQERNIAPDHLIDILQIEPLLHRVVGKLSGGERQRVAIARALATHPSMVLADEPTANLDSKSTENLLDMMEKLNKEENITFFFL